VKIFVTGTRGVPDIPGGVEKHCQELYPLIVKSGHEVILATRTPYVSQKKSPWQGIQLCHIFALRHKSIEAIFHTFLSIIKARFLGVDLVHIHSIGPGILVPFARLLGMRVVITNHGADYEREKWGKTAKAILRLGEYLSGKFAHEVIAISSGIAINIRKRCNRESNLIYNGVPLPVKNTNTNFLERLSIIPGKYCLAVARFVPEKGLHDLLAAFEKIEGDYQLVIAGDADHETPYSISLKTRAATNKDVILTGYVTGEELNQIFSHALFFILPSSHEGLPIALLEAMSYELPVLISDIPANKEVGLEPQRYFQRGNPVHLANQLQKLINMGLPEKERTQYRQILSDMYNWPKIAEQTIRVYEKALADS
jgi:glycosyltransferase involved in cell wall biosynthesis